MVCRRMRRTPSEPTLPVAALALAVGLLACGIAAAHAVLKRTEPAAGATLHAVPGVVTAYFDSDLEAPFSKLRVVDGHGAVVSEGSAELVAGHRNALSVKLRGGASGAYHVHWVAVNHDGHRVEGDYSFSVR